MSEETHNVSRTIEVSIARVGLDGGIARSITVAFGQLAAQPYWDNIQNKPNFATVATSGNYNDLSNKPDLSEKQDVLVSGVNIRTINEYSILGSGNINIGEGNPYSVLYTKQYLTKEQQRIARNNIEAGTSDFSGSYDDLSNKPVIPVVPTNVSAFINDAGYLTQHQDISNKADMVRHAIDGNLAALDRDGNLIDSRYSTSDFATAAQGAKADSAYQKPSSGIPAADLASGVIPMVPAISTDISADATSDVKTTSPKAVKTFVEGKGYTTNTGTVTGVTVGTTAYTPTSGVVTIPAYPDTSNLVAKSNTAGLLKNDGTVDTTSYGTYSKPSGGIPASDLASGVIPTVPTISTNVVTDKASDTKTSSPKSVYDEIHPAVATTQPSGGFLPNIVYQLGTITGSVTFALATPADSSIANYYYWSFDAGSTAPTITWPAAITSWFGGSAPTINASKHYEISVLGGIGVAMEV